MERVDSLLKKMVNLVAGKIKKKRLSGFCFVFFLQVL